jgi:hypothetical protein
MVSNLVTFFLFQFLKERIKVYEQNGTKVIIEEDPVCAVVIVTPIMQRAHSLPLASKSVFMDITSSCNSENHAITFLLTPCEAGAVPLAEFISSGRQADYETSFNLLKEAVGENLFGGQHYPKVFMNDDSLVEQNAIVNIPRQWIQTLISCSPGRMALVMEFGKQSCSR